MSVPLVQENGLPARSGNTKLALEGLQLFILWTEISEKIEATFTHSNRLPDNRLDFRHGIDAEFVGVMGMDTGCREQFAIVLRGKFDGLPAPLDVGARDNHSRDTGAPGACDDVCKIVREAVVSQVCANIDQFGHSIQAAS